MERDVEERFQRIEAILERNAEAIAGQAEAIVGHAQAIAAHKLAMAQLDEHLTHLAAMQIVTEQKLQGIGEKLEGLIDALRRGGNGKH